MARGLLAFLALAAACGDDAAAPRDTGPADGGPSDAGAPDAGARDAGPDLDPWFEDVTVASGIDLERVAVDGYTTLPDRFSGGVCVLDADGTAPLDLFFALRNDSRLYVASEPWSYRDETTARGLADVGDAMGCLAFDADGDADTDLLVTTLGGARLFRNDAGTFARADVLADVFEPLGMYMSSAAGDLDRDGDRDLVIAGFERFDPAAIPPDTMCRLTPCTADLSGFRPLASLLLLRRPDGTYEDATARLAPDLALAEPTLVVAIEDLDEDLGNGVEIYVGNDLGRTYRDRVLARDADGVYRNAADRIGLAYDRRGQGIDTMGWSSADLDGDERIDHVATSYERDATAVFLCTAADGICLDYAMQMGTEARQHTFRWGAALADFDLDGWPELIEATGHYLTDEEAAAGGHALGRDQPPNLYRNAGGVRLEPVEPIAGEALATAHAARGIAVADLDDDGRPDVVLAPAVGRPALLRNVRPPRGRWLRVVVPSSAAGARLSVSTPDRTVMRNVLVGEGYLGNFDPRVLVGVASAATVDVRLRLPDGSELTQTGVATNTQLTLR
jgi:hypothetical protein